MRRRGRPQSTYEITLSRPGEPSHTITVSGIFNLARAIDSSRSYAKIVSGESRRKGKAVPVSWTGDGTLTVKLVK